jgi:uroporphyrinogen-III synthase
MADQNTHPVVITRPRAQAETFARRVAAAGREAIVFPLLDILPLQDMSALREALEDLAQYAMVAFVSPNAIDAAFSVLQQWPNEVAIGVMGEGSRAALAQHGLLPGNATIISPRDTRRTDSQTLLEAMDLDALRGKRVLIVRGESGRELLADALRSHGVLVTQVAAYRRCAPVLDAAMRAALTSLLEREADWLITSSEALRILMRMVRDIAGDAGVVKMQQQNLVVPHIRIAETARAQGFVNVALVGSGDEHLFAALQSRP